MSASIQGWLRALLLLALLAAAACSGDGDGGTTGPAGLPGEWPTFAANLERTGFNPNETPLTKESAGDLVVKWQFPTEGPVAASPVVATVEVPAEGPVRVAVVGSYDGNVYAIRGGNGQEAKRCTTTVNDPCSLDGYRFHQAGFFGFGAELRFRDLRTGNTVYREVLALDRPLASPRIEIRGNDGVALFGGTVPQTDLVEDSLGALLTLPEAGKVFWVGLRRGETDWTLVVFDPSESAAGDRAFIPMGGSASVSGLVFDFESVSGLPSLTPKGVPLPVTSENADDDRRVLLALENGVFGTRDASAGDEQPGQSANEPPVLHVVGIAPMTVRLAEGDRVQLGPYEYEFVGPRNFTGISVKKDRGDTLIWAASRLFVVGLALTLWLPRQRAWFRLKAGELRVVSQGRGGVDPSTRVGEWS